MGLLTVPGAGEMAPASRAAVCQEAGAGLSTAEAVPVLSAARRMLSPSAPR